jgi:hypothetical protein
VRDPIAVIRRLEWNSCAVMPDTKLLTLAEVATKLSLTIVPHDSRQIAPNWWWFNVFGVRIYCYNFAWRRDAIAHHDLHHVLTGYPCTIPGEMQVATWEFAAGRYRNACATLFCLPLVAAGALTIPGKIWSAFRSGRRSHSLYETPITVGLLNMPLDEARARFSKKDIPGSQLRDCGAFATLVCLSFLLVASPLIIIWTLATRL